MFVVENWRKLQNRRRRPPTFILSLKENSNNAQLVYEGTESKNVPSQRKVFPGGDLAHVAPESGFPLPQSQEHRGPALTTGPPLR